MKRRVMVNNNGDTEKIFCSAIHLLGDVGDMDSRRPINVSNGVVVCGRRHCNCISTINHLTGKKLSQLQPYVQGFLTSHDRFVDRKEAAKIAYSAGQIYEEIDELFSEDVW